VEEVGSILRELLAIHDPALPTGVAFAVGGVYAAQGDGDNAVMWLNKGIEEGFRGISTRATLHVPPFRSD